MSDKTEKTEINFLSGPMVYVPGMFRWSMAITAKDIQPDAQDVAARMFMLAALLPALTGPELKRVAEKELEAEIDDEAGTVSFVVERGAA
jgi:hypothetical protein